MDEWTMKAGANALPKFKKFQKVPPEKKYNQRVVALFTKAQLKIIMDYCHRNNLTKGDFIREATVMYLQSKNISLTLEPEADPRQTTMF